MILALGPLFSSKRHRVIASLLLEKRDSQIRKNSLKRFWKSKRDFKSEMIDCSPCLTLAQVKRAIFVPPLTGSKFSSSIQTMILTKNFADETLKQVMQDSLLQS